jgi:hypothetical protein
MRWDAAKIALRYIYARNPLTATKRAFMLIPPCFDLCIRQSLFAIPLPDQKVRFPLVPNVRNLSPKLDPRTALVTKITKPQGRR